MRYSAIGLIAVLILLIENWDILLNLKGAFEKPAWKVYRRFLLAVLTYYVTDILWGVFESRKLAFLLFADTTVYYIVVAVGVLFWVQYTVAYLEDMNGLGRVLIQVGRVVAGAITLITTINIFAPILFTVDGESLYRALPLRNAVLVVQILLLLLISAYAITSMLLRLPGKKRECRTLSLFGLLMALFLFGQLWYPFLPLYTIAYMLGTCLLHSFVVNDEKADYELGMEKAERVKELKDAISSLLDNIPGMMFTKDAETGVYLACNQAFATYVHRPDPDGVIGYTAAELFDPATAANYAEDDRMALSMDDPYIFFEDVTDAEGNQRQYQTTKLRYTDAAQRQCVLGMCQDVTDMVRIQRENATSKDAYEKARGTGIIYSHIAQAMTRGFQNLYYVNIDSEEFIEYRMDDDSGTMVEVRRGWHFFEECRIEAERVVHTDDRAAFIKALDRKTLTAALDRNGVFVMTFRLISESDSRYVSMRVSRMEDDERYIILGITNIDEQMKQRRAAERMREEQIAYARLSALAGDYLCVYVVVPGSGRYREFSASAAYETYALAKEGMDFFAATRENACRIVFPDDLNRFLSAFSKESILSEIERCGIYTLSYRIILEGKPTYIQLKAAMVEEEEGDRLVVGVINIDAQVRQEEEYVKHLAQAQIEANIDPLTGVKNRHAYLATEEHLDRQIAESRVSPFAIVILDVNDLKKINDTAGHQAGDQFLRDACKIVCDVFKRSPVFRVGGDEFAVVAQGADYQCIDELVGLIGKHNADASRSGGIVVACGMSKFDGDDSVAPVFARADQNMYENKNRLKEEREVRGR